MADGGPDAASKDSIKTIPAAATRSLAHTGRLENHLSASEWVIGLLPDAMSYSTRTPITDIEIILAMLVRLILPSPFSKYPCQH